MPCSKGSGLHIMPVAPDPPSKPRAPRHGGGAGDRARHRLARVPYVGVSRAVVQARAQRRQQQQQGAGGAWVFDAQDIYLDVALYQGGGGGAWGAGV